MQPVTYSYKRGYRYRGKKAGGRGYHLKRTAHRRQRAAVREYVTRQDWDQVIEARPITDWDVG